MPWNLFIAFALFIFSSVITALTAKKPSAPTPPDPAGLGDFSFPNVDEGTPQIVVFGDVWITGWQVLWYGDLRSDPIQQPGGGGGGKK